MKTKNNEADKTMYVRLSLPIEIYALLEQKANAVGLTTIDYMQCALERLVKEPKKGKSVKTDKHIKKTPAVENNAIVDGAEGFFDTINEEV